MKAFDQDLVSGSILRSVWKLGWPMVLLNMVNGMHGFVDHALVGHFVSSPDNAANAGIGVAWQVFMVVVVFISSLYHGMSVLVARYAGRQDRATMSATAYQTLLLSVYILVFVMGPLGWLAAPYMLRFTLAKPEVMAHAVPYIRVLFIGGAPVFLMFMVTGAMQASGDARVPLVLGVLATLLNIVLSYLLITGAGPFPAMGATGAAVATCLAPLVSVCIGLFLIWRHKTILHPPERFNLIPDWAIVKMILKIGIPSGLQGVLLNVGGVMLLRYIGSLPDSAAAQAVYTICYAQLFSFVAWPSWALRGVSSTIIGQNIGAGDVDRGKRGVYLIAVLGGGWAVLMGLLYWNTPEALLAVFGATDEPVRSIGIGFLRYLAFSGIFLSMALAFTGGLIGTGDTLSPLYIAFFTQIGIVLGVCEVFLRLDLLTAEAVWTAILTGHLVRLVLSFLVFRRGAWRAIRVEVR
jgi:putative MATE family efflux protein